MTKKIIKTKSIKTYNLFFLFSLIYPLAPLLLIYFKHITNSYSLSAIAFGIMGLSQAILEIPTSIVADKYKRKTNIIISSTLFVFTTIFWLLAGYYSSVTLLFIGCFLSGVSTSFESGCFIAMLYEYLQEKKQEKNFNIYYAEMNKYGQIGTIIGSITAIIITINFNIIWLAVFSVVAAIIKFGFSFKLKENKYREISKEKNIKHLFTSLKKVITNKKLRQTAIASGLEDVGMQTSHRFEMLYFAMFVNNTTIILIRLFKQFMAFISFALVKKINTQNIFKSLVYTNAATLITRLFGFLLNSPMIISASHIFYGGTASYKAQVLQSQYSNKQRATMDSILSLFNGFLSFVSITIAGFLSDAYSPKIGMLFFIAINLITTIMFRYIFNDKYKKTKAC